MKKQTKKLTLVRATLRPLSADQIRSIAGATGTDSASLNTWGACPYTTDNGFSAGCSGM